MNHVNLQSPIDKLTFSATFREIMQQNELATLEDITDLTITELLQLPGFNTHHLVELVALLEKYGLAESLKHAT